MKKLILIIVAVLMFLPVTTYADDDISTIIGQELKLYDFSKWNYSDDNLNFDASKMVEEFSNGRFDTDTEGVFNFITNTIKKALLSKIPLILILVVCAGASGLCAALIPDEKSGLRDIVSFISVAMCIAVLINIICDVIVSANKSIDEISKFSQVAAPILSLIMVAAGRATTETVFSPAMAYLSGGVIMIIKSIVIPIVIAGFVLAFAVALTGKSKIGKLFSLSKSAAKWICGGITAIFLGAVTIYGLGARSYDNLLLKTTKYMIDKSLPIAGGLISGTADTIVECFGTIKVASGIVFMIIAVSIASKTLIDIIALIITLKISSAVCQPIADEKITRLISDVGDNSKYLLGAVAVVNTMLIITVGLCTCIFT